MRMYDIIEKKKRKIELSDEEIRFFIDGVTDGSIPDYQISALLMAIYFNSMTDRECAVLTDAMARSGSITDLSALTGVTADKHSSGGVGDKTTLVAAPIAAALGIKVAKMSGRGLGHTGGTIDKLEAIPGFCASVSSADFINQVNDIGIAVVAQSGNMAPADKRLYALRDVTATVNSIPLIASSIMSKKIAAGSRNIVLDVKFGSGAFMKTPADAELLAEKMIAIGKRAGLKTAAVISSMEEPLGCTVGNALEVQEAARTLDGGGPEHLRELALTLSALMYSLAFEKPFDEGYALSEEAIAQKTALSKLCRMVEYQKGNSEYIKNPDMFPKPEFSEELKADRSGYVMFTDTEAVGSAASLLGAGRAAAGDKIDHAAGIIIKKKTGEYVNKGDTIAILLSNHQNADAIRVMNSAVTITPEHPEKRNLIYKIISDM